MTSRLRRKRRTILPLVWTLISGVALVSSAKAEEPARLPPLQAESPNLRKAINRTREKSNSLLYTQGQAPGNRGPEEDDDYIKIESEPPSRDKLFRVGSEEEVLKSMGRDLRAKDPTQIFFLPAPIDRFFIASYPTLGPLWFQNRKTGVNIDGSQHRGDMKIEKEHGVHPAGAAPEVAIIAESIGAPDLFVNCYINLGNPKNIFGIVLAAGDPNQWIEEVDQIKQNSFYYVVLSADQITVGKSEAGKRTPLKSAKLPVMTSFNLAVTKLGDEITVYRGESEILKLSDNSLKGEYVGLIALSSVGQATTFDNFFAMRYGGPYTPRAWIASTLGFKGPSVHYWPLYFEQLALERYGQHLGNWFQPWFSHVMFCADFFFLPYSIGKSPPWQLQNNDGLPPAGMPLLPFRVFPPVCDQNGVIAEAAVLTLGFALFP